MDLISYIKKNPFFLAPMAGITDRPFRSFMRKMGCGIITTELISAKSLIRNNIRTQKMMDYTEEQRPIGIQIFGDSPETIEEGVRIASDSHPDFIDLNLGCPVNKIVKDGAGSALLKDLKQLTKVLRSMKRGSNVPVSLKVRTGWNHNNLNANKVAQIAYDEGFIWMTIHGRTREQGYSGKADWDYISQVKSESRIPIIGNGDIITAEGAFQALKRSSCDGVMIGRGCLYKPWIFEESLKRIQEEKNIKLIHKNSVQHNFLLKSTILERIISLKKSLDDFYDERLALLQLKKFCAWYSSGHLNSRGFRQTLFQEKDGKESWNLIQNFFEGIKDRNTNTIEQSLTLKRGHG